jgi:hypothetical protein
MSELADDGWKEIPEPGSGKAIKYRWYRNPFEVTARDSGLVVSTEIRYQIKYAHRVKQPWPFTNYAWITLGSCGYNEPMRRVRVTLISNLKIQTNWQLYSSTTITTDFIDKCEATFLGIDITKRIKTILDQQLSNAAVRIDERVPEAVNIRAKAEELWQKILQPAALDTSIGLWLAIQPHGIQLTPPTIRDAAISFIFYLRCRPLITLGKEPASSNRSFMEISSVKPDTGFHVELLLDLNHEQMTKILTQRFVGTSHTFSDGRTIQIDRITLSGDNISTTLALDFHGDLDGRILLSGTPACEPSTQTMILTDLDYSISTGNIFFKISDWWNHSERLAELRQRARWDIRRELLRAQGTVNAMLAESQSAHVRLSGTVLHLEALGVISTMTSVICGLTVDGTVKVELQ